jgi:hypothetical protein
MILDKLVGGNSHDDLAWLVFDESGERKYGTVSQAAKQAEKYQKSEKTRHDLPSWMDRGDLRRVTTTFSSR